MKKTLMSELRMEEKFVNNLLIANTHRIPKNPESEYKSDAPEAIIVKLVRLQDRNRIVAARKNIPRTSRIAIRTDLPQMLKKERAELSRVAYTIRRERHWQTQIRESSSAVWLMVRKDREDRWTKFTEVLS